MAKYSKINIIVSTPTPEPGDYIDIKLGGQLVRFTASSYNDYNQRYFQISDTASTAIQLRAVLNYYIQNNGLSAFYSVSDYFGGNLPPTHGATITALQYGSFYDFAPFSSSIRIVSSVVNSVDPPTVTATTTKVSCSGGINGTITLSVSGGVGPYTYAWAHGPTTANLNGLSPGTYTVTVTDSDSSTDYLGNVTPTPGQTVLQVTVFANPPIVVVATINGSNINLAVNGGTGPYTFEWAHGPTTANLTDVVPGTYTCLVVDSLGCSSSVTVTVSAYRYFFSRNPVVLPLSSIDSEVKPNLSFVCQVLVELVYMSNNFVLVWEGEQPANIEGKTVFDVSAVLDAYVEPHLPIFNQTMPSRADSTFKRFRLRHAEKYGTPPVVDTYIQQDTSIVVCGGLGFIEYAANTWFSSYQAAKKPFFTWDPGIKEVLPEQPEFLYFMPLQEDASTNKLQMKVQIYYTDGTTLLHTAHTIGGNRRYELWCLPCGYEQLKLAQLHPTKTVQKYTCYVTNLNNVTISEQRTFQLDWSYYHTRRFFLFANSLGGCNTLACTGQTELKVDPEQTTVAPHLPYNYNWQRGDLAIARKSGRPVRKVYTGFKPSDYLLALQDFLISERVLEHTPDGYIPGTVAAGTETVQDDADGLQGLSFEFTTAVMHRYTPVLRLPVFTEPIFVGDLFTPGVGDGDA